MNMEKFFNSIRSTSLFNGRLTAKQVEGMEQIIDECLDAGCDTLQTAYILGTGFGESGGRMHAVRENLNYTSKTVTRHFGSHRRQGLSPKQLAGNPRLLGNTVYGGSWGKRNLGNRIGTEDGYNFRGFWLGQITGYRNAKLWGDRLGIDIVGNPAILDDPKWGAVALVRPMMEGWATGKKLPAYVGGSKRDYLGARVVWGGVDAAKYVGYAKQFEAALRASGYRTNDAPKQKPTKIHEPKVVEEKAEKSNWLAALIALFFKGAAK